MIDCCRHVAHAGDALAARAAARRRVRHLVAHRPEGGAEGDPGGRPQAARRRRGARLALCSSRSQTPEDGCGQRPRRADADADEREPREHRWRRRPFPSRLRDGPLSTSAGQ